MINLKTLKRYWKDIATKIPVFSTGIQETQEDSDLSVVYLANFCVYLEKWNCEIVPQLLTDHHRFNGSWQAKEKLASEIQKVFKDNLPKKIHGIVLAVFQEHYPEKVTSLLEILETSK